MVRKFIGRNPTCARRIFTERLPDLIAAYARKTRRLVAARLRVPISAASFLRLVWAAPGPPIPTLQAVGLNERA
jgi:hypothetical protein